MKTVDYSDCKALFALQPSKDAASEGPEPRVSSRGGRAGPGTQRRPPAPWGGLPSLPRPPFPVPISLAPSESAEQRHRLLAPETCRRETKALPLRDALQRGARMGACREKKGPGVPSAAGAVRCFFNPPGAVTLPGL